MYLRFLFSLAFLIVSYVPVKADIELKINHKSLKATDMPWISRGSPVSSGSSYFYASSCYDGGRMLSFFVPFIEKERHHLWWDTGIIVEGTSLGYRYVCDQSYFSQSWFLGVYKAFDRSWDSSIPHSMHNIGFELGGSQMGQLTLNTYYRDPLTIQEARCVDRYRINGFLYRNVNRETFLVCDNVDCGGFSVKWLSIPNKSNIQVSMLFAVSHIYKRATFSQESVLRIGLGSQFNLRSWCHIDCQLIFDKYKFPLFIGLKLGGMQSHFVKDKFQGRLRRPPQRHMPSYAAGVVYSKTFTSS